MMFGGGNPVFLSMCDDFTLFLFSTTDIYIDNRQQFPQYEALDQLLQQYAFEIEMIDRSNRRYIDLYCL